MNILWQLAVAVLFVCVLPEGLALVALGRAVGLLQIRLGPEPGALQTSNGLALYADAPPVSGFDVRLQRPVTLDVSSGRWGLIFITVTCPSCRELIRDAGRVDKDQGWGARIVVISQGTHEQNEVLRKHTPDLMLLSDPHGDMHKQYAVESTPYAFLVAAGRVEAKGVVNHRDHLEALLERKTTERPGLLWTRVREESPERDAVAVEDATEH